MRKAFAIMFFFLGEKDQERERKSPYSFRFIHTAAEQTSPFLIQISIAIRILITRIVIIF